MGDTMKKEALSICFFAHSSQLGGAERCLLELIIELIVDYGANCSVFLPNDGPLKKKLDEVGALTGILDLPWWCDSNLKSYEEVNAKLGAGVANFMSRLNQEMGRVNPDIVFTSTIVIPWGAIAANYMAKPHVWYITEFGEVDPSLKFYLPLKEVVDIIRNSSNYIFTISDAVKNTLFQSYHADNISTLYPYISVRSSEALSDSHKYFKRGNAIKLVITGRITESKGQQDAIFALRELVKKGKDVELVLMGNTIPAYLEGLRKIITNESLESRVHFYDLTEKPYPCVNQADIVLVCSRNEAFGRVTLEAMLLKKPVIGTNTGGTPELVKEGFNGLLYTPGDYNQLADKIDFFIEHREKIKEFGDNGYEFSKKNFTKQAYGGRVYQLLKGLKDEANPSSSPYARFITKLSIVALESQIERMHSGIIIQLYNRYQRVIEKILCSGTRRRYYYELGLTGIRVILNEGWKSLWQKCKRYRIRRGVES